MSEISIFDMTLEQLIAELPRVEMRVREINRLIRKKQKEDLNRYQLDHAGNPKRIKKV